jgi:hypothetical protein
VTALIVVDVVAARLNIASPTPFGLTITMRELLFCPRPWVAWFESVAKSRPRAPRRRDSVRTLGLGRVAGPPLL